MKYILTIDDILLLNKIFKDINNNDNLIFFECNEFLDNNTILSLKSLDISNIDEILLSDFRNLYIDTIRTFYPRLNFLLPIIDNILNNIIQYNLVKQKLNISQEMIISFILQSNDLYYLDSKFIKQFKTIEEIDNFYNNNRNKIDLSYFTEYQMLLYNKYENLINLPQPIQKSNEWFQLRKDMLTASNGGAAIGESHFNNIKDVLLDKIGYSKPYKENDYVYHGKKYEKIATMIYEYIYNTKIGEFGLIQHPTIKYLGASPDGISMSLTLDSKPNNMLGKMLEIKCPITRKINTKGKIKGDIVPAYYYTQVILQLECCDLDECDFWQCRISEYSNIEEFYNDDVIDAIHSENQLREQKIDTIIKKNPNKIIINPLLRKGLIIELIPLDTTYISKEDKIIWYAKYIYPPTLLFTYKEYNEWVEYTINNLNILYPEYNNYKYSRTIYWKLESSHNELITRKKEWFNNNKYLYEIFWKRVLYYREHLDEIEDIMNNNLTNKYLLSSNEIKILQSEKEYNIKNLDIFYSDSD